MTFPVGQNILQNNYNALQSQLISVVFALVLFSGILLVGGGLSHWAWPNFSFVHSSLVIPAPIYS